jgi:hypothetical protein
MTVGGSTVRSTSSIHPLPSNDDHPNSEEASGSGKSIRSAKSIKSGRSGGPRPGASGASGSARSVSARTASSASDTPGTPADTAKIDFSVTRRPTRRQLWEFSKHELFDEDGNAFPFGKLYPDWPKIGPEPPEDDEEEEEQGQHGREREVLDDKPDHELSEEWETLPNPILQLLNAANSATKVSNPSHPSDPSHHLQPSTFGSVPLAPPVPEVKERKTAVFFIRALACGQCQDFVRNSISRINPETVAAAGVSVYVITNGGWKGLKKYRELMKCPFPIFVDPKRDLYTKLG